jgi:hypothetical protein
MVAMASAHVARRSIRSAPAVSIVDTRGT